VEEGALVQVTVEKLYTNESKTYDGTSRHSNLMGGLGYFQRHQFE
jgi:hypothetical protein